MPDYIKFLVFMAIVVGFIILIAHPGHENSDELALAEAYSCGFLAGAISINKQNGVNSSYKFDDTCLMLRDTAIKHGFTAARE